jgi:hypothetical protein
MAYPLERMSRLLERMCFGQAALAARGTGRSSSSFFMLRRDSRNGLKRVQPSRKPTLRNRAVFYVAKKILGSSLQHDAFFVYKEGERG